VDVSRTGAVALLFGSDDATVCGHAAVACAVFTGVFVATTAALTALRWLFPRWSLEPAAVGYAGSETLAVVVVVAGVVSLAAATHVARAGGDLAASTLAGAAPVTGYYAGWLVATVAPARFAVSLAVALAVGVVGFAAGQTARTLADE
jgi:hypothetical protein